MATRSYDDFLEELGYNYRKLKRLTDSFDEGDIEVYRDMSSTLRMLLHESSKDNSDSLYVHLDINNKQFIDSAKFHYPMKGAFYAPPPLIDRLITFPLETYAILDENIDNEVKVDFKDWWSQKVIELEPVAGNPVGGGYTRKTLVLAVANNMGGTHTAMSYDPKLQRLVADEGVGDSFGMNGEEPSPILKNEIYSIRQIAYETLKSLEEYFNFEDGTVNAK